MALTERQQKARLGKMTGSRIASLMSGDEREMYDLWLELTGDPSFKPPDYSNSWAVQLGNATEQFHLDWLARNAGEINRRGESAQHPRVKWAACTLDGWVESVSCPVEAKHTGGFEGLALLIERYMPQMQWTMYCTEAEEVMFSAILGAKEPAPVFIARDEDYIDVLLKQASAFMRCVFELREPVANPYVKPPAPVFTRMCDMTGSNSWAECAGLWLQYRPAHIEYEAAAKHIKKLVPADAKETFGHGIRVKRNKAGSLTIKSEQDNGEDERADD